MKRFFATLTFVTIAYCSFAQPKPVLQYDFSKSNGQNIIDVSGNSINGTLKGSAKLQTADYQDVVDLGNNGGYIDMGPAIGQRIKNTNAFTVAVKYYVKDEATLNGNGYFLWAFSTLELNTKDTGRYHAYKLNKQCSENSVGGWTRETLMKLDKPSEQGKWKHAVYTQDGTFGRLYVDGRLVAFNNDMFTMSRTFDKETPVFNWIGRAPFNGDAYLANTLISDVRIYTEALSDKEVRTLSNQVLREDLSSFGK